MLSIPEANAGQVDQTVHLDLPSYKHRILQCFHPVIRCSKKGTQRSSPYQAHFYNLPRSGGFRWRSSHFAFQLVKERKNRKGLIRLPILLFSWKREKSSILSSLPFIKDETFFFFSYFFQNPNQYINEKLRLKCS